MHLLSAYLHARLRFLHSVFPSRRGSERVNRMLKTLARTGTPIKTLKKKEIGTGPDSRVSN